jgi:hypothetical protein
VAIDVDVWSGEPVQAGGQQGHIAVLAGWHRSDGVTYFTARHPQANGSAKGAAWLPPLAAISLALICARNTNTGGSSAASGKEWTAEQLLGSMCQMRITKKAREQDLPAAALPHLCLRADISGGGSTLALDPAVQLVRTSGFPLCCRAR